MRNPVAADQLSAACRGSGLLSSLRRIDFRNWLRLFAVVSACYSFLLIFDMDHYLPWQFRFFRALELTLIGHFGLWLATYKWRGWVRFVVALVFFPTLIGISILWGYLAVLVLPLLVWRLIHLLK